MSQNLSFYIQKITNPEQSEKLGFKSVLAMLKIALQDRNLDEDGELCSSLFQLLEKDNSPLPIISGYEPEIQKFIKLEDFILSDRYYLVNKEFWEVIKKEINKLQKPESTNLSELNRSIAILETYQEQNILVVEVS